MRVRFLLIGVVALFVTGLLASSSYAVIDFETCVGMWLFDEGAGNIAEDSSGSGNHGTLTNGPEWVAGKSGGALSFDGADDYVDCGNASSLNEFTSTITAMAWVKLNSLSGKQTIISKAQGGAWGIEYSVSTALYTNKFSWAPNINSGYRVVGANDLAEEGVWYHLAGTYDGSVVLFYIDGVLQDATMDIVGTITPTAVQVEIGSNPPGVSNIFNGVIDEVAVFNVALEQADIESIMNMGLRETVTAVKPSGKLTTTWAGIKTQ